MVKGGEDYQFDGISVQGDPRAAFGHGRKTLFRFQTVHRRSQGAADDIGIHRRRIADVPVPPRGHQILTMGSMNFIERELEGLRPESIAAGAGASRTEIYDYTKRLLTATGFPRFVLPTHSGRLYVPYENEAAQVQARKEKAEPFMKEAAAVMPRSEVIMPVHLQ